MNYPDIPFSCPTCEITLKVRADAKKLTGPCPKCKTLITAPDIDIESESGNKSENDALANFKPITPALPSTTESLLLENTAQSATEENHHRKKPRPLLNFLIPLLLVGMLVAGAYFIVTREQKNKNLPQDEDSVTPAKELTTHSDSTPPKEPPLLVKPNLSKSKVTLPPLPESESPSELETPVRELSPKKQTLAHDPQDLIRPGEIPSLTNSPSLTQPFEGTRDLTLYATHSSYCFEDLPAAKTKATIRLFKDPSQPEYAKAYLSLKSSLYQELIAASQPGEKRECSLSLRWNSTEDPARPYLELVRYAVK